MTRNHIEHWAPALALGLLGGLASAQSFSFSPSQNLAGDALVGIATGDQLNPAISRGNSGYLAVWADRRAKLSTHYGMDALGQSGLDIWARLLDSNGNPTGALPFVLDVAPGDDKAPQVSWNGQSWLVTWSSQAPLGSIYGSSTVGMRISGSGQKLDPTPFVISDYPNSTSAAYTLASDGSNWVVAMQGSSGGSSAVMAKRISAAGVVLDPTAVELYSAGSLIANFDLEYAGGVFLLTWSNWWTATGWDIAGMRFDSALQKLDPVPVQLAATTFNDVSPAVGSNGSQFFVAFERYVTSTFQADIQGVRVTSGGTVLDPVPISVTGNLVYGNNMRADVVWDGSQWWVSWSYSGLSLARVSSAGSVIDFGGFLFNPNAPVNSQTEAKMAADGTGGVQLVWTDNRAGSYEGLDIYGAQVDGPSAIGPESVVSTGASAQLDVDLATDGTNYMAVYRSETSGQRRILAARLDSNGASLDPQPIEIAVGLQAQTPAVAFTNGVWLVTWVRLDDPVNGVAIYGRRLDGNGNLLDANPILIGTGYNPEVAGMGNEFLVAWSRPYFYPEQSYPHSVRVRASDGAVLGTPLVINSNYARVPDVAVVGGRWAIVWQRNWSHDNPWADVAGAFLNPDGSLASTFGLGSPLSSYNYVPRIASSGSQALVVWQSNPATSYTRRILARRVNADGSFPDPAAFQVITAANPQQVRPSAAWDGTQYLVAFEDTRTSTAFIDELTDVYVARVTSAGAVLDPAGIAVETTELPEHSPAVIGAGAGRGLLAASILRTDSPFASYRLGVRTFDGTCPTPAAYCTAKVSSGGCVPAMFSAGVPSYAAPSGFSIGSSALEPQVNGIVFFGLTGADSAPFQDGFLCVKTPLYRLPVKNTAGAGACSGSLSYTLVDFVNHPSGGGLVNVGTTIHAQTWFRDPPAASTTGLSNGMTFTVCP